MRTTKEIHAAAAAAGHSLIVRHPFCPTLGHPPPRDWGYPVAIGNAPRFIVSPMNMPNAYIISTGGAAYPVEHDPLGTAVLTEMRLPYAPPGIDGLYGFDFALYPSTLPGTGWSVSGNPLVKPRIFTYETMRELRSKAAQRILFDVQIQVSNALTQWLETDSAKAFLQRSVRRWMNQFVRDKVDAEDTIKKLDTLDRLWGNKLKELQA